MTIKIYRYTSLVAVLIFSCLSAVNAQDYYKSATISPELIKNANAVIRLQEETIDIKSVSSATYNIRQIVTILNKDGLDLSVYHGFEDKFIKFHFDRIIIYDKTGKKVKSFGSMQVKPTTTFSFSIYDDNYYYYVDPEYMIYPFTADISYSISYNGLFSLPDWFYYNDYNVSTENSNFTVTAPEKYVLRYKERGLQEGVKITKKDGKVVYVWEAKQIPALLEEPLSVSAEKYSPAVMLAPVEFEYAGREGSSDTWNDFGHFVSQLNKDRNIIEGETVEKVKNITNSTTDTVEIIKKLYQLMQDKTRYVSIQIGIGGWQPITAQKVDNTSYGDCKALSNYMKSLLDIAEIKSNYTLVYAGDDSDDIITDLPSTQFNHAILSVPRKSDTIWLECTSQKSPFNYLGSFTDDRHVLLITENGGKLARTPRYTSDQNSQLRSAVVTLDLLGNATASVSTKYNYYYFDENIALIYLDQEGIKKRITNSIDIPGFTLVDFSVKQKDPDKPVLNEDLSLKMTKYATVMGDRMLIPLNLMNRSDRLPSNVSDRKMDIEFMRDMSEVDTITYKVPVGYSVASTPQPMEYTSPFGSYRAEVIVNGKEVTYIRNMRYNKGVFPVSQYPQLVELFKNIATADNTKIALKKL